MSHYDGIAPREYEITWMNGHVETVKAHQVSWPGNVGALYGGSDGKRERVRFHAEIDGQWVLTLEALVEDIRVVRDKASEGFPQVGGSV